MVEDVGSKTDHFKKKKKEEEIFNYIIRKKRKTQEGSWKIFGQIWDIYIIYLKRYQIHKTQFLKYF